MSKIIANYTPKSMSFMDGFFCDGKKKGKTVKMTVDEEKAMQIINDIRSSGRNVVRAELGLDGDFSENHTVIFDGEFHPYDAYYGSLWATPILMVYYAHGTNEQYECWR